MDKITLGARISDRRNYLKMNQEELARHLDISRETISNWERGTRGVDSEHLQPLATALGTTVGYFFGEFSSAEAADDMGVERGASGAGEVQKRLLSIEGQLSEVLERLRQSDKEG